MDAYEVMGVERRLELDLEDLRVRHDAASRRSHPDAGGGAGEFSQLRESYEILRDPVRRVRHWLELAGRKPGVVMDGEAMAIFDLVGGLISRADEVLRDRSSGRSALVRSLAERKGIALLSEIEKGLERVGSARSVQLERFREFDTRLDEECLAEVATVAGALVFLDKWERQLRERWIQLGI